MIVYITEVFIAVCTRRVNQLKHNIIHTILCLFNIIVGTAGTVKHPTAFCYVANFVITQCCVRSNNVKNIDPCRIY